MISIFILLDVPVAVSIGDTFTTHILSIAILKASAPPAFIANFCTLLNRPIRVGFGKLLVVVIMGGNVAVGMVQILRNGDISLGTKNDFFEC